jgi:hypothetical protein
MAKKNDRTVSPRQGGWANKKDGAQRAASVHRTQAEAIKEATEMLRNSGGGELKVQNQQGRIRSKDTIAPGNESLVKDKEH